MKKVGLALLCGFVALSFNANKAEAIPVFAKQFEKLYAENSSNTAFAASYEQVKSKCDICHYPTAAKVSKKFHLDYGEALSQLLKKEDYTFSRVKAEPEAVDQELTEAFKKVEKMKANGGSETYLQRIEAGKLPGTPTTEAEIQAAKAAE